MKREIGRVNGAAKTLTGWSVNGRAMLTGNSELFDLGATGWKVWIVNVLSDDVLAKFCGFGLLDDASTRNVVPKRSVCVVVTKFR